MADRVRADAAVTINGLVRWTISRGLAGLEAWAGTPGTVGGAIYGNAHFERPADRRARGRASAWRSPRRARSRRRRGARRWSSATTAAGCSALARSCCRPTSRVAAAIRRRCARTARESLAFRKRTQPLESPSAGCIFQNPDPARGSRARRHSALRGCAGGSRGTEGRPRRRGARVADARRTSSSTTAARRPRDIRALIDRCRADVRAQFGVELRDEIVYLG